MVALILLAWTRRVATLGPTHGDAGWPRGWPWFEAALFLGIVAASAMSFDSRGQPRVHRRWAESVHQFTWGAGLKAMRRLPSARD
jgi:hypothetical protein